MLLRASFEIIRLIFMFYGFHVVCIFMCQWNYKQAYRALHTQFPMKFKNTTCIQFNSAKKCGTTLPGTREINLNLGEKVEWRDKQQICGMKYNLYSCLLTNLKHWRHCGSTQLAKRQFNKRSTSFQLHEVILRGGRIHSTCVKKLNMKWYNEVTTDKHRTILIGI